MTEPRDLQALSLTLAQLAEQGAAEHDPLRFAYLSGLHARLSAMPRAPQRLWQKLENGLAQCQQAISRRQDMLAAPRPDRRSRLATLHTQLVASKASQACTDDHSLAALLQQQTRQLMPSGDKQPVAADTPMLRGLAPMRQAHARQQRLRRISNIIHQAPNDAGPLNSHRIVAGAMKTLQQQTPAYLDYLVSYLDSLIALERVR